MTLTERLHAAVSAVCPIYGVYIDDPTNKATWGFTPNGATAPQITAGTAAITAFDNSGGAQTTADAQSVLAIYDGMHTQATDIASAATVDLSVATGPYVSITGTTTITAFTSQTAGQVRRLTFAGSLTLTHNATSLICPGGINILTAAGDRCEVVSLGSGNWQVRNYQVAASPGVPVPQTPTGRLTLTSGVPVTTSDVTGATTLYYTPFISNVIPIYDGAAWSLRTISEISIQSIRTGTCNRTSGSKVITNISFDTIQLAVGMSISGTGVSGLVASVDSASQITSDTNSGSSGTGGSITVNPPSATNWDVFAVNNAGTIQLRIVTWTSDTVRASAISSQNGIYVNTSVIATGTYIAIAATTGTYLGTIRTSNSGGGQLEDSNIWRSIWNMYNRRIRLLVALAETTNSWNYTTATWRLSNATTDSQVRWVVGMVEDPIKLTAMSLFTSTSGTNVQASTGIGINTSGTNSAQIFGGFAASGQRHSSIAELVAYPSLGYSYAAWLEISEATGTTTWYGDNGGVFIQTGMVGTING